jgi:hypothetical protein
MVVAEGTQLAGVAGFTRVIPDVPGRTWGEPECKLIGGRFFCFLTLREGFRNTPVGMLS